MNSLLDSDRDQDIEDSHARGSYQKDREITLGTTMVLGIFFALALFAAVFFGFGYSMGAKHAAGTTTMAGEPGSASFSSFKPAPGSPIGAAAAKPGPADTTPLALTAPGRAAPRPSATPDAFTQTDPTATSEAVVPTVRTIPRAAFAATTPPPAAPVPTPISAPAPGAVPAVVQVAAVSHQEDADLLVTTLKRRGYNVAVRSEPQDHLLHVQIGPFPSKAEATAMRQKLLADGFNAIVK